MSHRMKNDHVRDTYMDLVKQFPLTSIRNLRELKAARKMINSLLGREPLDEGEEEYLSALSDLVGVYEDENIKYEAPDDSEMLRHLMEAKGISQSQLATETDIAKSIISEVLSGKRELSKSNIVALSQYFKTEPGAFLGFRKRS